MDNEFFNEDILKQQNNIKDKISKDYSKFNYNIRKIDDVYHISCENDKERLNPSEIKDILKQNEDKKFLTDGDVALLNYLGHRLGMVQTMYKIVVDIDTIFSNLKKTKQKIYFLGNEIKFADEDFKLDLMFKLDEQSNILLNLENKADTILGLENAYLLQDNVIYTLSNKMPIQFYKEIFEGKNKFSIDSFLKLKETLSSSLKGVHNVKLNPEIEKITSLPVEKKEASLVFEASKTNHFITIELKYKIGDELFKASDFKYAETVNWQDKTNKIKTVVEDKKLIEYTSDLNLSESDLREIFQGARVRPSISEKDPLTAMLPIAFLEAFVKVVIPNAQKKYPVEFKNGETIRLADGRVKFEVDSKFEKRLNLFEFKVKFKIEDEYFDLEFLKELMTKNKKFIQLKDGTTVNIENIREINKWIEFLNKYEFKRTDNTYKAKSQAALELDEFLKDFNQKEITSNEEYKNLIQEMKDRKPIETIDVPSHIQSTLRDYQKEGVYWMHFLKKYGFGGILADEMGLGKTIQALTIIAINKGKLNLVICPKTLLYNWESEVKKFFPTMKVLVVDGNSQKRKKLIEEIKDGYDLVITSYSLIQKDYPEYVNEKVEFEYKILDEAHYVKNMKTLSAKAVRLISAKHKILLTGTPLENNLEELYGTFDLIMPGYLGSKLEFRRDFISKIERNNLIALEILQAKIRPFILRRTKKEVLKELPDKQEQVVFNEMSNKQIAVYNEVLNRVKMETMNLVQTQGWEKSRIQVLSALLKLRQVCNHPQLLDSQFKGEKNISGKHDQFLELLEEVTSSGSKVLVFSQFTSMLDIFERDLKERNINYLRLDGSTKNRQEVVNQFNEDEEVQVFLISLKAGGVGLNLTAASAVFLYDPWWNPMAEKQAIDRAHRIGQKKTVNIYKFITKNSIEEKILKLQERKGNLFENLVVDDNGFFKKLEWEDLMELFE